MGVADCDNMLMLLALPNTNIDHSARHIVTRELMRGFAVRACRNVLHACAGLCCRSRLYGARWSDGVQSMADDRRCGEFGVYARGVHYA
jgi:hypothetical protein